MDIETYTPNQIKSLLVHPQANANKYTRGKLVVIAGSCAYPGAACLSSFAAQRMGAGYVEVVCAPESIDTIRSFRPSFVVRSWNDWSIGNATELIEPREGHPVACVIGTGFDAQGKAEQNLVLSTLREVTVPVLVDGGAITILATGGGLAAAHERADRGWPLVVTPHGGEASRMEYAARLNVCAEDAVSMSLTETQAGERAQALACAYRCVVALKGSDTYLSNGDRTVAMCEGTPALAKAGTGDVLAGMIGALLAQGLDPLDACVVGTTIHAKAGNEASVRLSDISVTAEDVIDAISPVICDIDA